MANSEIEDKSPASFPFLIKIYGENVNRKYQLKTPVVNIGRHPNSHITVDSLNVSRYHCVVRCEKGAWILKDNNSQNGTYINGKKLEKKQEYTLQCGDIVFLGPPAENPQAFCFDDCPEKVDHVWISPGKEKDYESSSRVSTQSYGESYSVQSSKDPEIKKSKNNSNKINNYTSISSKMNDKHADTHNETDNFKSFAERVQDRMSKNNSNLENKKLNIPSTSQGLSTKSKPLSPNQNESCSSISWSHQPGKEKDSEFSSRVSAQSYGESYSVQSSKDSEIKKSKNNSNKTNNSTSISSKMNDKRADTHNETDNFKSFAERVQDRMATTNSNLENKKLNIPSTSQGLSTKSKPLSPNQNESCSSISWSHQSDENSQSLLDIEEEDFFDQDSYPFSQMLDESESAPSIDEHVNLKKMESVASNTSEIHLKDKDTELLKSKLALLSEEIKHLEHSKSSLLKEYVDVCEKNKMLDQQLAEQQKLKDDMLMCEMRVKNKFKSQIMEKVEEELICNICTEVLIKPTVLDCSHTFCEHCILEWKKKKSQCPICRNQIKSMTRILALDHFIDKTLETLTPGQKEKRKELVLEREHSKNPLPKPSPSRGRARRRGRSRRYSYNRRSARPAPTRPLPPPVLAMQSPEVIQLDHSVSNRGSWLPDIFLSDTDNDSSIEMMDHFLEPCYNCGRYDHMHYECPGH